MADKKKSLVFFSLCNATSIFLHTECDYGGKKMELCAVVVNVL